MVNCEKQAVTACAHQTQQIFASTGNEAVFHNLYTTHSLRAGLTLLDLLRGERLLLALLLTDLQIPSEYCVKLQDATTTVT